MANFKYKAQSAQGQMVSGVIEAPNRVEAVAMIRKNFSIISEITEVGNQSEQKIKYKKMNTNVLSLLCDRFSIILNVGLPITSAITMLANQMEDKYAKAILTEMSADIAVGRTLADSMESKAPTFPSNCVEAVRAGEDSGNMVATFERLKVYYAKQAESKQKVTSAMIYPAIVIGTAIVVAVILMIFAIPEFEKMFDSMGTDLPGITQFLINMSDFVMNYGIIVALIIATIVIASIVYSKQPVGARFFSRLLLGLPILGKLAQLSSVSEFAHTMSLLLSSGMPILRSIEAAANSMSSYSMRQDVLGIIPTVEGGASLGDSLDKCPDMPKMLTQMVAIGEQTGTIDSTLDSVARYYDNEVNISTDRAINAMNPIVICFLAVIVVVLLLAVYLPMFSMYGDVI